jgi:tetratricopeptide (TPR) repeat protein
MKEIFVGREDEIKKFTENFEKQSMPKKEFWDFKNKIKVRSEDFYKLFLIYGDGGFGKSALARVFSEQAISIFKERQEDLKVITIDWDNAGRIDSFRQVLERIYAKLAEPQIGIGKFLRGYTNAIDDLIRIQKIIEAKQKESEGLDIGQGTARGLQTLVGYIPTVGDTAQKLMETELVEKVIAKGINYTVQAGEKQIADCVKSRNILNEKDYRLWLDPNNFLIQEFVKGFKEASKENAILLVIDTYERIDQFDEDLFLFFLRVLEEITNRITIVVSGRRDLSSKYKEKFSDKIALFINLEKLLFKEVHIQEFAKTENLTFSDEELKEIVIHTRGIPFAVKEVISNIKNNIIPKEKLLVALRSSGGGDSDILISTVNRFIKYCNPEDRKKVFSLAILKEYDKELLRKLWGEDIDVESELESLSERHSFISQSKESKNKTFNEYLRKYLILELDESKSSIIRSYLKNYGEIIAEYWFAKLKDYEKKEPEIGDRYSDKNYISFLKNYINAVAFADIHKLFSIIPGLLLESMQFNLDLCKDLINALHDFEPPMTNKQKEKIKISQEGISKFEFITEENVRNQNSKEILKLVNYFEENRNFLNDLQKTILEFRHGEIIFRNGYENEDSEKAFEHFNLYENKFKHLIKIKKYLCDQYTNIGYKSYEPDLKIPACSKAIEYDPNNAKAYSERAIGYSFLHNLENFVTDFNKALEIEPNNSNFYCHRGIAYYMSFKDNDSGLKDLTTSIDIKPYWFAYFHRGLLNTIRQEYERAIADFDKLVELKPDIKNGYAFRGRAYSKMENYEKALENFNKILSIDSNNSPAYYGRGKVYFKMGNYETALEEYNKALKLDEKNSRLLSSISQVLFILNREHEAIDALNKSFSLIREGSQNWRVILLVNWFCTYAHIPEKREEAKMNLLELTSHANLYDGKEDFLKGWKDEDRYLVPNVEKSIREGHPEPELLKELADKVTDILT